MLKSCLYMHLSLIFLCVTFSTNLDGQTYTRHRHFIPSNWSSTLYETPPIKVVFRSPSLILDVPMDKRPGLRAPLECILHLHLYNLFFSSHGRSFIFLPWTSKIFRVRAPVRIKRKLERAYLYKVTIHLWPQTRTGAIARGERGSTWTLLRKSNHFIFLFSL